MIALYVVAGLLLLVALAAVISYNRFVIQRNLVRESWRQVDVELRRRYDLIPNLIETVKGYAAHERGVFERVTAARTRAVDAGNVHDQGEAETALTGSLRGLLAVGENYPHLKAAGPFRDLQAQLATTEDRIAAVRRFYNGNVRRLNIRVEAVPSNLVASVFHFGLEEYFEVTDETVRQPVKVDFGQH